MKPTASPLIRLKDYKAPDYLIESVDLDFTLHPTETKVRSKILFKKNWSEQKPDFTLDGEQLTLLSARINGEDVKPSLSFTETGLSIEAKHLPDDDFTWEADVQINPSANTSLDGLYMSKGMYCTQCEAQGFRKITYYLDRPDVMAQFSVAIKGDMPIKLSNGNDLGNGTWFDPWPKPAYLFALVAGELVSVDDSFTTRSGRDVSLKIWVREGDEGKCDYAMDALKRAIIWDEQVYGCEYDLDLFQIVAVDDFNMGAMENKGLNIFNSAYVLVSPETATDRDYELVEAIIAHEYFHNWTGNRITCRDWFQLSLKEGLTVFRDQQFSGDERSQGVKRIDDVLRLRSAQFTEDAGPLAHPVRPEAYKEINNFYTATVYEKGAEIIRMLKLLVGDEAYYKALALYFERHDGQACTIEDWLCVFEDACDIDLTQFKRWYSQAGTPHVTLKEQFKEESLTLEFSQTTPPTPNQPEKKPQVIPIALAGFSQSGEKLIEDRLFTLKEESAILKIDGLKSKPVLSFNRNFSAPIKLKTSLTMQEKLTLLSHDDDLFNKWEAAYQLGIDEILRLSKGGESPNQDYIKAMGAVGLNSDIDPNFRAYLLALPSTLILINSHFERGQLADPEKLHSARTRIYKELAQLYEAELNAHYQETLSHAPYSPDAHSAGRRAINGMVLSILSYLDGGERAEHSFNHSNNMTETLNALSILIREGKGEEASNHFYEKWQHERLVIDKWFSTQLAHAKGENALESAKKLSIHPDFDWQNPNRFRALFGGFARNQAGFHRKDGKSYEFLTEWILKLDAVNPQTAARFCGIFENWKHLTKEHQSAIRPCLQRLHETPSLSKNSSEIIEKIFE